MENRGEQFYSCAQAWKVLTIASLKNEKSYFKLFNDSNLSINLNIVQDLKKIAYQ